MIKRALAATLCLIMVFALLPKTARAAENDTINFSQDAYVNWHGVHKNYAVEDDSEYDWSWDASENKLTLEYLNFETDFDTALKLPAGMTVELNGENTVTLTFDDTPSSYGVYCAGTLSIQGTGTLTATGGTTLIDSYGVYAVTDITVNNACITGTDGTAVVSSCGINATDQLTLIGGQLVGESTETAGKAMNQQPSSLPAAYDWRTSKSAGYKQFPPRQNKYVWDAAQTYVNIRTSLPDVPKNRRRGNAYAVAGYPSACGRGACRKRGEPPQAAERVNENNAQKEGQMSFLFCCAGKRKTTHFHIADRFGSC